MASAHHALLPCCALCWFCHRARNGSDRCQWSPTVSTPAWRCYFFRLTLLSFYFEEFNITNEWQKGLLNGGPYLCSAVIGCWTSAPLNRYFGRRGTIFVSCFISFVTGIWMTMAGSWWNLLPARFALGFAVGAKSSTTPVDAAECAPKTIRGALTMMWCVKNILLMR